MKALGRQQISSCSISHAGVFSSGLLLSVCREHLLVLTTTTLFRGFHGIPLVKNSTSHNSVSLREASFGDSRCSFWVLSPLLLIYIAFICLFLKASILVGFHTTHQMALNFHCFCPYYLSHPPLPFSSLLQLSVPVLPRTIHP